MATEAAPAEAGGATIARRPSPSRRIVIATAVRAGGSVVAAVGIYYLLPLNGSLSIAAGVGLLIALVTFVAVGVSQVKSVVHASYPAVRATQVLSVLIPVFILTFATYYYVVARQDPSSFSDPLTRTDALYFTVTVLSTVGFGDITAESESARIAVTLQMVADLAVLGVLVRTAARAVAHGWERQDREAASPSASEAAVPRPAERP